MQVAAFDKYNSELLNMFSDSTLGLFMPGREAELFSFGTIDYLDAGDILPAKTESPLHVVLDGRLAGTSGWFGPGNHFGTPESELQALDRPARVWVVDTTTLPMDLRRGMTKALIASDMAEAAAKPADELPEADSLCDADHPKIRRQAARLRRASPASTAEAILKFVHGFPYRFGAWQERASDTLKRGVGMCTTKTNLQVALMRAAGLEAGFVEVPMPTSVLGKLMPSSWLALQRPTVRHYFAAVKLNGVWHGADSSYDYASYRIFLEMFPWMAHREEPVLTEGAPYIPCLEIQHKDLFDITVVDSIAGEMGKKSRFETRHFEALNTHVDRARGVHQRWLGSSAEAVAGNGVSA